MTEQRTFDYIPRLDERNRAYRVSFPNPAYEFQSRYWVPGPVLDQGREGACVGFGVVGEALASPVRVRPTRPPDMAAHWVYKRAQQAYDPWPGENYEGTSVLAGMKVGQELKWWAGYRWAFNMAELRAALEEGPVVIGVEWRSGMYEAPGGVLGVTGSVVGGHCILVTGYTPLRRFAGSLVNGPAYRFRNSWSASWGVNGSAYISTPDLDRILFQAGGEAAVPIGRAA